MTQSDCNKDRYSVCIGHETGPREIKFFRVADYYPDAAEERNELVPAATSSNFMDRSGRRENPDYVFCQEAYRDFPQRRGDIYLLEWHIDPSDQKKHVAKICRGHSGLPTSADVKEVVDIPEVQNIDDLIELLKRGHRLKGAPTKEFYLVYKRPADHTRLAIKCDRKEFVGSDGVLRLLPSLTSIRQSVLTAPAVLLDEKKIIKTNFPELEGREIYSDLGELEIKEPLLLRSIDYYAADYVKYYLEHCETTAKLTDKERRYAVARAIREALSRPKEIEEYLGAKCPEKDLGRLKTSIAAQTKAEGDDVLKIVQDALIEDESIRNKCIDLTRKQYEHLFSENQKQLNTIAEELRLSKELATRSKKEITILEEKKALLQDETVKAEKKLAAIEEDEAKAERELDGNIALKLGLRAVLKEATANAGPGNPSKSLTVLPCPTIECKESESGHSLTNVIVNNLKKLGVDYPSKPAKTLGWAAAGIAGCAATGLPMVIPEPMATPVAMAVAAAIYSAAPTRVIVPADYRGLESITRILTKPGVYIVQGVIDSANEGILFALLRQWEASRVVLSFRSHASAMLLAREAWGEMFMPSVETLTWTPYFMRRTSLITMKEHPLAAVPKRKDVLDEMDDLAEALADLSLPRSMLALPAAIGVIAEEEYGEEDASPVIAQHLAVASGATAEALEALSDWLPATPENPWLDELRLRLGLPNE